MIVRQDGILKILKDIRDINSGKKTDNVGDVEITISNTSTRTQSRDNEIDKDKKTSIPEKPNITGAKDFFNLGQ